jgi:flagellar motor switch protein FliM
VLERLGQRLGAALRGLAGGTVGVEVEPLLSDRLGEHLSTLPAQAIVAPFEAAEWGGPGFVIVDGPLVGLAVDLFLGGSGPTAAPPPEGRRHTAIETALVERLIGLLLLELGRALAPVAPTRLRPGRIEIEPRFLAVDRPAEGCVIARVGLALGARRGVMEIVLPQGTLEAVRGQLTVPFAGARLGHDPVWARHLADELWAAGIELEAVLDAEMRPLRDALALEVGSVLPIAAGPETMVSLRYVGRTMLTGRLGRSGERIAVRIEERLVGNGEGGHG